VGCAGKKNKSTRVREVRGRERNRVTGEEYEKNKKEGGKIRNQVPIKEK